MLIYSLNYPFNILIRISNLKYFYNYLSIYLNHILSDLVSFNILRSQLKVH